MPNRSYRKMTTEELVDIINTVDLEEVLSSHNFADKVEHTVHKLGDISNGFGRVPNTDWKIEFDFENFTITPWDEDNSSYLVGISSIGREFSFVGCIAGGDWETPVFFILYFDNTGPRVYIPTHGNVYCKKHKCAWGSCPDDNLNCNDEDHEEDKFDWVAIEEDIKKRFGLI